MPKLDNQKTNTNNVKLYLWRGKSVENRIMTTCNT